MTLMLSGCGGGSVEVGPAMGPHGPESGGVIKIPIATWRGALPVPRSGGAVNAALAELNFSASSVDVISNSGTAVVKAKLENATTVSTTFGWVRNGQSIAFSSPSSVNSWLATYWDDIDEVSVEVQVLSSMNPGNNTLVMDAKYGGNTELSATRVWTPPPGGWCDPGTGQCYNEVQ